jgi:hypothetical protein
MDIIIIDVRFIFKRKFIINEFNLLGCVKNRKVGKGDIRKYEYFLPHVLVLFILPYLICLLYFIIIIILLLSYYYFITILIILYFSMLFYYYFIIFFFKVQSIFDCQLHIYDFIKLEKKLGGKLESENQIEKYSKKNVKITTTIIIWNIFLYCRIITLLGVVNLLLV